MSLPRLPLELWVGLVATVTTLVAVALLLPVLRRVLVDLPNARSGHREPTPRGGGVAVVTGIVAGLTVAGMDGAMPVAWLLFGMSLAFAALGLVDDFMDLSAMLRLAAQCVIGLVAGSFLAAEMEGEGKFVALAISALFLVTFTNMYNFMDGLNGISAVSAIVTFGWYAFVAGQQDSGVLLIVCVAATGACLGFLPWNFPSARVFLGDVGSYGIGSLQALLAAALCFHGAHWWVVGAPLLPYIIDTSSTLVRRAIRGEPLLRAHRMHAYQLLADSGWPVAAVVSVVASGGMIACLGVLIMERSTYAGILLLLVGGWLHILFGATASYTAKVAAGLSSARGGRKTAS